MPTPWQRPEVLFPPDRAKAALVVIDMQNFACAPPGGSPLPGLEGVVGRINALAGACRESGVPVIWVRHALEESGGQDDGGMYGLFHSPQGLANVARGSQSGELFPAMQTDPAQDHFVCKNRYSAFLSDPPELRGKLAELGRSQLLITGVAANVCVESTLRDAMQLDYEVILIADGTTGPDRAAVQNTINNTRLFFGDVRQAGEVAAALGGEQA